MISRRPVLAGLVGLALTPTALASEKSISKLALKSGPSLPPIGMGTWQTFDVALKSPEIQKRRKVLEEFFRAGGGMIDSSPMYGRSEEIIGYLMKEFKTSAALFSATKIWTPLADHGALQLENSQNLWKEPVLDLVHVHNLLRWEPHLKTLRAAKENGDVRYIGLTTSHGRRHGKLEQLIQNEAIDAVQFTYNILDREAENRLLPAARDKGLTVIINRPFRGGQLFESIKSKNLPEWAVRELDCQSWAEYFLKFISSHHAVHCAIPATRQAAHMKENMRAGQGPMPDAKMRAKMIADFEAL